MCNEFHRMEAGVCNQFHIMEAAVGNQFNIIQAGVGAHEAIHIVRTRDPWKYEIAFGFILHITICLIEAIWNANSRTDALLNVTRIAGHETVNTTLDEDLSNCTTSSLKNCTLINDGTWYIETKNSFYGNISGYSSFIDNSSIVSWKELRDGDVSEEQGLPCAYYVRQSISIGCSLSSALFMVLTVLFKHEKLDESIAMGLGLSWHSFLASLLLSSATVVMTDFSGNIVGMDTVWSTLPSLLHFHLIAFVGWMSVFSQRYFLVRKKSGTAVSTCGHVWDVIVRWAPFCAYFPAFFLFNWLFSSVLPQDIMPACNDSSWLTQNTRLFSFIPPIAVFSSFNCIGLALLIYREQHLKDPRLKENFFIILKLYYIMYNVWGYGVLANEGGFHDMLRFVVRCIFLIYVVVCSLVVVVCSLCHFLRIN